MFVWVDFKAKVPVGWRVGEIGKTRVHGMLKAVTFDLWQTLILDTSAGLRWAREDLIRGIHEVLLREKIVAEIAAVAHAYDAVGARLEGNREAGTPA
jgi:hypothetical protein